MTVNQSSLPNQNTSTLREEAKNVLRNYFLKIRAERLVGFYFTFLEEIEPPLLVAVARYAHNNQSKMAKILGVSRGTLYKMLKKYDLC